jgi:hypothetical protein
MTVKCAAVVVAGLSLTTASWAAPPRETLLMSP